MSVAVESAVSPPSELRPPLDRADVLLEADRCLVCSGPYAVAPCTSACPAQVDVPAFIDALSRDDVLGAAETIFAENVLGGTCSRVCPVEVLCQSACVLLHEGDAPSFLNVVTDCPVGWGHEPRLMPRVLGGAVDSHYWPLYEVVDGRYVLSYEPDPVIPVAEWLALQTRFAHLLQPDARPVLDRIQAQVDADWSDLLGRCAA